MTLSETRTTSRPEEAFPGVPADRMDIAAVKDAPLISPDAKNFLVHLTRLANRFYDQLAHDMLPEERNDYFTIHETHEGARMLVHKTAEAVFDVTRDLPHTHLVIFPAGAIPIAKKIIKMGFPQSRMHALDISGSNGTTSGSSSIKTPIPQELLRPDLHMVIPEDIIDSIDTVCKFIAARGTFRDPSPGHIAWLNALGNRLKAAHANGNNDPGAYADFAKAATQESVSLLSVWSKNDQALHAIWAHAFGKQNPLKNAIQQELLKWYPITSIPPTLWVLGGDYTMDTGVQWHRIAEHLPAHLQKDPRVTQYMKNDTDGKIQGEWLLRAVRIGPLAYFERETQEANVIKHVAKLATQMLEG